MCWLLTSVCEKKQLDVTPTSNGWLWYHPTIVSFRVFCSISTVAIWKRDSSGLSATTCVSTPSTGSGTASVTTMHCGSCTSRWPASRARVSRPPPARARPSGGGATHRRAAP